VQRLLGYDAIVELADRMAPGGSGNPYEGLTTHQRRCLPPGLPAATSSDHRPGADLAWSSLADELYADDPSYFENFWTQPGCRQ
jgi:hypothetical protein